MERRILVFLFLFCGFNAFAQVPIGQCIDQTRQQAFSIYDNGYAHQVGFPQNAGWVARDPSGQTYLRMPAASPTTHAFFVSWQGQLIEVNNWQPGPRVIGYCQFPYGIPAPPPVHTLPQYAYTNQSGVLYNGQTLPVPQQFYSETVGFSPPPLPSPADAQACLQSGGDPARFVDCLAPKMFTKPQAEAYECARTSQDQLGMATCLAGTMVGAAERTAINQVSDCYRKLGKDWDKYTLCMANGQFSQETAAAMDCVKQQSEAPTASAWAVAGCIAGNALSLNAELTVAVECAMTSQGEPMTFAGCTGGRLTVRELEKCFTHGVGGNGCFGPNNEIVKGLRAVGVDMEKILGPNGFAVQTWNNAVNDVQHGPGPNNEIVKAIRTINNDLNHGMGENNDIRKVLTNIGLGGLF